MTPTGFYTLSELAELGLASCGRAVLISRQALLIQPDLIAVGSHVRIDAFCILSAGPDGITIGDHVHLSAGVHIYGSGGHVELADFVCVSGKSSIYTVNDDYTEGGLAGPMVPTALRQVQQGDVRLQPHALVGCQTVILPGVELGRGCAVGALSLVKQSVPAGHVVGGCPARFLKLRNLQRLNQLEAQWQAGAVRA